MMLEFTVGINIAGKHESVTVAAEDALIAAQPRRPWRSQKIVQRARRSARSS